MKQHRHHRAPKPALLETWHSTVASAASVQHFTTLIARPNRVSAVQFILGTSVDKSARGEAFPLWQQRSERRESDTDYWSTYIIGNSKFMGTGWSSGIQSYSGDRGKMLRQLFARRARHNKWYFKEGNIRIEGKRREEQRKRENCKWNRKESKRCKTLRAALILNDSYFN